MSELAAPVSASVTNASPYVDMPRSAWAELAASTNVVLNQSTINSLRGLGDPTLEVDVQEVYHPLTDLIRQYIRNTTQLFRDSNSYLGGQEARTPFVIAIAGSVAVGKSTVARLVAELLRRSRGNPKVELITTDGFLYPNDVLIERGILEKKGFPESYDARALLQFVIDVKSGLPQVSAPVYSHSEYDVLPDQYTIVDAPDILVIEGVNVLQPARIWAATEPSVLAVSDFVDFSVYVDAREADIRYWFIQRFLALRDSAFQDPNSYYHQWAGLSDTQTRELAMRYWDEINGPNLRENIAPTKRRATAILRMNRDHTVESVRIRKI